MAPRHSNEERARLRNQCRVKLADHIKAKIGIEITPSQVRLKPKANDPYIWKFLPEREEHFKGIFSKSIGAHSINAYRDICDGVEVSFEAVPSYTEALDSIVLLQPQEISFSSKIRQLTEENAKLSEELYQWKNKAIVEEEGKNLAQQKIEQRHEEHQWLQRRVQRYEVTEDYMKSSLVNCLKGLNTIVSILEELRSTFSNSCS